ncbi:MAG: inorganic phosphate transporter [Bacteroidales bacterium]
MEQYFIVILCFLGALAIFDLFVGVSNDAVNFLNSAIGSRIAPFRVVMLVASLGVLLGATFSSGMMEVARSGVFHPSMFTFNEIIVIFFAVMVTDIILLDVFNSLGLPTSTTVSIVFELLGGAIAAAAYKLWSNPELIGEINDYINNKKALAMISAILISVVVAFLAGAIIQYIVRLIFTFKYQKPYRYVGSIFGGLAITAIFYFLVMKGAKGSSFMKKEYIEWLNQNTFTILLYAFVALTALFQLLISLFRVNIFKLVILTGTFALAFAFAGNDLVNFVGVPLAAYDSYTHYVAGGLNAEMLMDSLTQAVKTPTAYLLFAGLVMVLTLWFSKKAKRVVQTSINLSSSDRGVKEQFGSSLLARSIVRSTVKANKFLHQILPQSVFSFINSRTEEVTQKRGESALPFDQVRASINLVVASILIASATSLKLPLSTTYVTFMVAMGSSFADGAWDRESAVYRISGVLAVIGGWFVTALCALTICGVTTYLIFVGGEFAAIGLMVLVGFVLLRSNIRILKKNKNEEETSTFSQADSESICTTVNIAADQYFTQTIDLYRNILENFQSESLRLMRKNKAEAMEMHEEVSKKRGDYYRLSIEGQQDKLSRDARYYYYRIFTNFKEISHSIRAVLGNAYNHIDNNHNVFEGVLADNLQKLIMDLDDFVVFLKQYAIQHNSQEHNLSNRSELSADLITQIQNELLEHINLNEISMRRSELYMNFIQLSRDIVNRFSLIAFLQHELNEKCGNLKQQ